MLTTLRMSVKKVFQLKNHFQSGIARRGSRITIVSPTEQNADCLNQGLKITKLSPNFDRYKQVEFHMKKN
jgi:hypothetical protein